LGIGSLDDTVVRTASARGTLGRCGTAEGATDGSSLRVNNEGSTPVRERTTCCSRTCFPSHNRTRWVVPSPPSTTTTPLLTTAADPSISTFTPAGPTSSGARTEGVSGGVAVRVGAGIVGNGAGRTGTADGNARRAPRKPTAGTPKTTAAAENT